MSANFSEEGRDLRQNTAVIEQETDFSQVLIEVFEKIQALPAEELKKLLEVAEVGATKLKETFAVLIINTMAELNKVNDAVLSQIDNIMLQINEKRPKKISLYRSPEQRLFNTVSILILAGIMSGCTVPVFGFVFGQDKKGNFPFVIMPAAESSSALKNTTAPTATFTAEATSTSLPKIETTPAPGGPNRVWDINPQGIKFEDDIIKANETQSVADQSKPKISPD